jgi:predicted DNA-binding ribbon-helix-helix protein
MKSKNVRTSVDLPRDLHRRLREEAKRRGCSMRQLIVNAIEQTIPPRRPAKKGRLNLEHGLVRRTGKPLSMTNEEIYELGFP